MLTKEDIELLGEGPAITAANAAVEKAVDGVAALPDGFTLHDLERFQSGRNRARGTMSTSIVDDFARYVEHHAEPGATVFVNQDNMQAVGVLNLGDPRSGPGHADNLAVFKAKATAGYADLLRITHNSPRLTQQAVAEFMEDWSPCVSALREGNPLELRQAIGAVRSITIEKLAKLQNTEEQLSASRSTFEQVKADSAEPLPTIIRMKAIPYVGFTERTFDMRVSIVTEPKPSLVLRIVNAELHAEEMAKELALLVRDAIGEKAAVLVGKYEPKN